MTKLLEKAFEEAAKLPPTEQNALGRWLMEEILAERRWETLLAESEDVLETLADEALIEHREGRTNPLDIDES